MTVNEANSPLRLIRSKNNGPPPESSEVARTITGSTASPAKPAANTHVRTRCRDLPISTRNIGPLDQAHEYVLEALVLGDQRTDGHSPRDQGGVDERGGRGRGQPQPKCPGRCLAAVQRHSLHPCQDGPGPVGV